MYKETKYHCSICTREMETIRFSEYFPFCIVCEECDRDKVKPIFEKDILLQILTKQNSKNSKNLNNAIA